MALKNELVIYGRQLAAVLFPPAPLKPATDIIFSPVTVRPTRIKSWGGR